MDQLARPQLLIAGSFALVACGGGGSGSSYTNLGDGADGSSTPTAETQTTLPGEVSQAAIDTAQRYTALPLLWLGTAYGGFNIVHAEGSTLDVQGAPFDHFLMVYGTCKAPTGMPEPSCLPPLSIQVKAPAAMPGADAMAASEQAPEVTGMRGFRIMFGQQGAKLWLASGVTVEIYTNFPFTPDMIDALVSANHEALGLDAVGPSEDVGEFGDYLAMD